MAGCWRFNERGIALVSVLLVVLLLSIVAASMVAGTRTNGTLAAAAYDRARAEAIAEAGVAQATLAFLDSRSQKQWNGVAPYEFSFSGAAVTITIQDETGKIDLNTANDELLRSLFKSVGLSDNTSDGLFDKLADWRDEHDLRRLDGAKADDYRERGYPYGPRDSPFDSVEELREVMDVTPDIFEKVRQAVTVYSSRNSIDPLVAQPSALRALSQMVSGQPDALTSAQPESDLANGVDATSGPSMAGSMTGTAFATPAGGALQVSAPSSATTAVPITGKAFTVRAEVRLKDDAAFVLETVVRLTADSRQPYWTLRFKEAVSQ